MSRVGLIAVGAVLGAVLRSFGVPGRFAAMAMLGPFLLAEMYGVVAGPYESSARDVLHGDDDRS